MSKKQAQEIAKLYANTLRENKVPFNIIYLFGSYSQNKQDKDSDIDIMVVTKDINDYMAYKRKLWRLTQKVDTRIEPHVCNFNDFQKNFSPLAKVIKKSGVRI